MRRLTSVIAPLSALSLALTLSTVGAAQSAGPSTHEPAHPGAQRAPQPDRTATAVGTGGAVTSVDPNASKVGLKVLRDGGNAVDAAVATAAALGVSEPYSAGVGGGGYFVYYDAKSGRVHTIDGRETAPRSIERDAFIDPETDKPYNFTPELVTSGVSVGVPGTPATWTTALKRWGSRSLAKTLRPAEHLATKGFVVDRTFRSQTKDNRERFAAFTSTKKLYLRGGLPMVGRRFKNPDLAATYRAFGRHPNLFYRGAIPREISATVRKPPVTKSTDLPVPPGSLHAGDFARYRALLGEPTSSRFRGLRVFGMPPSSSGGIAVGEALNILENYDIEGMSDADALHHYLEASALTFADRAEYVGDARFVDVPRNRLLGQKFARERACKIDPDQAAKKPVAAGSVRNIDGECSGGAPDGDIAEDHENISTTHLTVADKRGNVVSYTLTIEQTGGSGIVVPGRGFLLNNELTDFSLEYLKGDPNRIQPGKRPRSSMSPTILLRHGKPFLALGSPGGSTIITTVLQVLFNRLDRGMTLPDAVAAPRASQRNEPTVLAEPAFIKAYRKQLKPYGHKLEASGDTFTGAQEIGALTGIEFGPGGLLTAVAEPTRRGGGDARVVRGQ